jgi:hypothetical protein
VKSAKTASTQGKFRQTLGAIGEDQVQRLESLWPHLISGEVEVVDLVQVVRDVVRQSLHLDRLDLQIILYVEFSNNADLAVPSIVVIF